MLVAFDVFEASIFWVGYKSGRTKLANRSMIFDVTGSVLRTAGGRTWIFASECSARLVRRTPIVSQANRQGGVAIFQANAYGFVIKHVATLFGGTGRLFRSRAGVLTDAVEARLVRRALFVPRAFANLRCTSDLSAFVDHETVFANASRPVVRHLALFVAPAFERGVTARVVALAGGHVTSQICGTVRVFSAV
jgi:hypothetical protein